MSSEIVIRLPAASAGKLALLRLNQAIQIGAEGDHVWLRVDASDQQLDLSLRAVPGAERFREIEDRQLVPEGCLVPSTRLPSVEWRPLSEWIRPQLPSAKLAGQLGTSARIPLVRGAFPSEANVLQTDLEAWSAYACTAPAVRLARWSFAVAGDRRVIVRGEPIPSLPGLRFAEQAGIAVESGCRIEPEVNPAVLATAWQLEPGDLLLLREHAAAEHIRADGFVAATRSAIRLTQGGLPNAS